MSKEWRIGSHVHDIGVTLKACHDGSLSQGSLKHVLRCGEVGRILFHMTSIFACEHLRTLTVVVVITSNIVHEPVLITIIMLIHEVGLQFLHLLPAIRELFPVIVVR